MSLVRTLLIGVKTDIITADASEPDPVVFALPTRTVILGWQTAFASVPGAADIDFDVSMDEDGPWTEIDGSTSTAGEFRTIDPPVAARFGRIDVVDSSSIAITVSVIAKVAAP